MSDVVELRAADPVEELHARGVTDGLPVTLPTVERIRKHVDASGLDPGTVVARVPPFDVEATVERIASNAVMAGCPAELMPVVVVAVRAICAPDFNLYGVRSSNPPPHPSSSSAARSWTSSASTTTPTCSARSHARTARSGGRST